MHASVGEARCHFTANAPVGWGWKCAAFVLILSGMFIALLDNLARAGTINATAIGPDMHDRCNIE
jgi:hypothetical protein